MAALFLALGGCLEPTPDFEEGPAPPGPGCNNDQVDDDEYCVGDELTLLSGTKSFGVAVADFNADEHDDVLVGRSPGGVALIVGRADGAVGNVRAIRSEGDVRVVASPDVDMDMDPDIVVTLHRTDPADPDAPTEDLLVVYPNESTEEEVVFGDAQEYPIGVGPAGITAADVNADEVLDLMVVHETSSDIVILDGNGDGTFTPRAPIPIDFPSRSIAVVDVNRDGQADILVGNVAGEAVTVLLQDAGMFTPGVPIDVGRFVTDLLLVDMDGNDQDDLVVICEGSRDVFVFLHQPDGPVQGVFADPVITRLESSPFSATAANLDRNGQLDLVTANREDATVTILLGGGDGTLQPMEHPVGGFPAAIGAGDVDDDNSPDLVLGNVNDEGGVSVIYTNP